MTSQQFSANKNAAKYDFKAALKKIIVPTVLTFIYSLIIFVISPLYELSYYIDVIGKFEINKVRKNLAVILTATNGGDTIGICFLLFGALFAILSFSFIMRKRTVNVFFSSSIDRRTLFKNRALASIIMMAAAIALPVVIDIIINLSVFSHAGFIIQYGLLLFAECFVYTLAGFAIMAIAMTYCSTIIESILFGSTIAFAPTVVMNFIYTLCAIFLNGYNRNAFFYDWQYSYILSMTSASYSGATFAQPSLLNSTSIINPLILGKAYGSTYTISDNVINFVYRRLSENSDSYGAEYYGYENVPFDFILPVIVWAVFSCCFILIARQLFIKLKAENAGVHGSRPFASRMFAVAFSISLFTLCIGSYDLIGIYFTEININVVSTVIPLIAMVIAYLIISAICRRTIKLKLKELITPASTVAVTVILIVIFSTGGFGYSTYVPDPEDVERAVITNGITDIAGNEISVDPYEDSFYGSVFTSAYWSADNPIGLFTDEEDIKQLTEINKKLTEETDNMTGEGVCVYYELKNGKIVSRYYDTTDYDAAYSILSLRDSKAAKEELSYLLCGDTKEQPITEKLKDSFIDSELFFSYDLEENMARSISRGQLYAVGSNGLNTYKSINNTPELRKALLDDLLSQTYEQRYKPEEAPIGGLFFSAYNYEYFSDYYTYEVGYYIYPSMTNTVNYLKSTGEYELFEVQDRIEAVTVESCKTIRKTQINEWCIEEGILPYIFITQNQLPYSAEDYENEYYGDAYYDDYYGYYEETLSLQDYFKNGSTFRNSKQISTLTENARPYYFSNDNDYLILIKYKNAGYVTKLIPADEIPEWVISSKA